MIVAHLGPSALPVPHKAGGAIQRRMLEISTEQCARGHRVILYSAADKPSMSEYEGVEIRSVPCGRANPYLRDI